MDIDLENIKNIETFLLDSLDALCLESSSNVDKISLLSAFQEKIDWGSLDVTSAEHVIGSLKNMYVNPVKYDSEFYRSQLLVTITVVLVISSSKLMNQHKHCETLHHSIEFLSNIISKVNDVSSMLTRKTACECLLEIEQSYPGLLRDKLRCFFTLCDKEKTVLFQNYMILFVTTLKNALLHLSAFQNVDEENVNCVSVLLNGEADVGLKMNGATEMRTIEEQFPITGNVIGGDCCDVVLPKTVKNKELKQAVSFIAENFHLLTNIPLFHVLFQLMQCIRLASLSPSVFKCQFVKSLFHTIDLPLFQIILLLQSTFKSQLFEEADVALLVQKLCQLSNQPSLGIYKRLLCFNWVIHFPYEAKPDKKPHFLVDYLDFKEKAKFHPTVFEPIDVIPAKLNVLSCCYAPGDEPDIASATLMNCLVVLYRPLHRGLFRPYATLLCQVLFSYFTRYSKSSALVEEIYKLQMSLVSKQPDLIQYVLDFAMSTAAYDPESDLASQVLRSLNEYIISLPFPKQMRNIESFLKGFEYSMTFKEISPEGTIKYIRELAISKDIHKCRQTWSIGHAILHVCKSILQYHDTATIIAELGDCLLTIYLTNLGVDICDRAMLYYTLLTTVSAEKCAKLLAESSNVQLDKSLLSSERSDLDSSSASLGIPIARINEPFLKLTRAGPIRWSECSPENMDNSTERFKHGSREYMFSYLKRLHTEAEYMSIVVPYYIHYTREPNEKIPENIFAAVVQIHTSSKYKKIPDIHVPFLSFKKSYEPKEGCILVDIKFYPNESLPSSFDVRIIFNDADGCSYMMDLSPITLEFHDIFVPLNVSLKRFGGVHFMSESKIFKTFWRIIEEQQYSRKSLECSGANSIVHLNIDKEKVDAMLERLKDYTIKKSNSKAYVAVFLPPHNHFLLRFQLHPSHAIVNVATDRWQVLACLSKYLKYGRTLQS